MYLLHFYFIGDLIAIIGLLSRLPRLDAIELERFPSFWML